MILADTILWALVVTLDDDLGASQTLIFTQPNVFWASQSGDTPSLTPAPGNGRATLRSENPSLPRRLLLGAL